MEREARIIPGYDCRQSCPHTPPGDHGIAAEEWCYTARPEPGSKRGVCLAMLSHRYPETVDFERMDPSVRSILLGPMMGRLITSNPDCEAEAGGTCRCGVTFLGAAEFWKQHGDPKQFEQSEAFWQALEAELGDE